MTEPWYKSKTKIGGVLIGGSMILSGIGGYLTGSHDGATAARLCAEGLGVIFVAIGIRNALGN